MADWKSIESELSDFINSGGMTAESFKAEAFRLKEKYGYTYTPGLSPDIDAEVSAALGQVASDSKITYHYDIIQGTPEWHSLKLGIMSASKTSCLLTPTGSPAKNKTMRRYAMEIAAQRVLGFAEEMKQSFDMYRGTMQEPIAREYYDENCYQSTQCGFVTMEHDGITIGMSPDLLVGDDGGGEIKSRLAAFQFQTIMSDEVPAEFMDQIQTALLVTGRKWWDFIQYSNGMPLFVKRVLPDTERHAQILDAVVAFEAVVQEIMEDYKSKASSMVQTEYIDWQEAEMITSSDEVA